MFDIDDHYEEYAEFLMNNADVPVANGGMLLALMEQEYMLDEFKQSIGA